MLKFKIFFIILQVAFIVVQCNKRPKPILDRVMNSSNVAIQKVVNQLKGHEVQILLTQVDLDSNLKLRFRSSSFQLDEENYFYPASAVKLPIAALVLQKLRELNSLGVKINANTPFEIRDTRSDYFFATKDNRLFFALWEELPGSKSYKRNTKEPHYIEDLIEQHFEKQL